MVKAKKALTAKKATTPKKNGRPKKTLNAEQIKRLEHEAGMSSKEEIANLFGVDVDTFNRILRDDPDLLRLYKKGRAEMTSLVNNQLLKLIKEGNPSAIYFFKKCRDGWRENQDVVNDNASQPVRIQFIGADGKVVQPTKPLASKE